MLFIQFSAQLLFIAIAIIAAVIATIRTKKLTTAGAVSGGVIASVIYIGAGFVGLLLLSSFFVLSVAATKHHRSRKQFEKVHEKRDVGQVIANGGVAALCSIAALLFTDHQNVFNLMMAASLSSATADTLSSELGVVYGRKFYNILNFKKDQKGLDGVISAEGTFVGVAGSAVIAAIYSLGYGWSIHFWWIIIAGFIGNMIDSFLGATLERKRILNNDFVNFLNTLAAALVALLLFFLS